MFVHCREVVHSSECPLYQSSTVYPYLDGVAAGEGIQTHGAGILPRQEVGPYLILWVGVVYTQVLYPCGEPLVQPEVGPPLHRHLTVT